MATKRLSCSSRTASADQAQKLFQEKFASRARYVGDTDAKKVAAAERRLATGLRNARTEFGQYLDHEQLEALSSAAYVMARLAGEASRAGARSRKAKVDHDLQEQRLREERADIVAAQLWGAGTNFDRPRFLADCHDLVEFIDLSHAGGSRDWMKANIPDRQPGIDDVAGGRRGPQLIVLLELYEKKPGPEELLELRRRGAEYMDTIRQNAPRSWHRNATLADFEAWKAARVRFRVPG